MNSTNRIGNSTFKCFWCSVVAKSKTSKISKSYPGECRAYLCNDSSTLSFVPSFAQISPVQILKQNARFRERFSIPDKS
jgi:hypothetical protein